MSAELARDRLRRLLRRWRLERGAAACLVVAASAALGWALAARLPVIAALGAAALAGLGGCAWVFRGGMGRLTDIARHLDRTLPQLEESAELLLADEAALSPLERLQQARVADRVLEAQKVGLPRGPLLRSAAGSAAILVAALLAALLPSQAASPARAGLDRSHRLAPPALGVIAITVRPPAYTGLPVRTGAEDLEVEAGALVTWRARVAGAQRVILVRLPADTLRFRPDGERWVGELEAATPSVYQLVAENSAGRTSGPLHRLGVRPDQPPTLAFTEPAGRTTLAPTASRRFRIAAQAIDDYGIAETFLLVTVASGAGEQVKFRERKLPFEPTAGGSPRSVALRRTLDLDALGLAPGDEAYLTAVARDGRRPLAQEGRSETVIVAIADTAAAALAEFAGLPPLARPAYLRSQRQIILDTERLLRERARIARDQFRERSAAIGEDQRLLRLRYADLLGGETVGDAADRSTADPGQVGGLVHEHDTEENATLLSPEVKRALTAAVARMWEAERALRTFEPRAAVPHEYAALEGLKEVQRSGRTYVRRTATPPPPLDLSRRLTGELKGAGASSEAQTREARLALPAARAALAVLERAQGGIRPGPEGRAALAGAVDEIAGRAASGPPHELATLRALQGVIDSLESPAPCGGCLAAATRGVWALLPAAEPAPAADAPAGRVGQTYLDLLAGEQ